jgi:DNA-binding MarR family transcriptional regulator
LTKSQSTTTPKPGAGPISLSAARRRHIARLAPLLPQFALALRRRRGELPPALARAGTLGERHIAALVSLAIAGPATVSELAGRTDMSLAHASLVVGELADAGLVEREHDEQDRRRIIVSLSDAAIPAVKQMRNRHAGPLLRFLCSMDDDEADQFIDHLSTLVSCLREDEPQNELGGQA